MKTRQWSLLLLGAALLAAVGCRNPSAIPILERQLRLQEDEIWRLRMKLEEYEDCSSSTRWESTDNRRGEQPAPRRQPAQPSGAPAPQLDITIPGQPSESVPDTLKRGNSATPSSTEPRGPSLDHTSAFTPSGDSRQAASITIDPVLTGGINSGDRSGDQGVLVVVEPRNQSGQTIDAPAEMSVVVLDPASLDAQGKAARVGRWDFTAAETAALFRRTESSRAVHLAMAWPNEGPKHNKLHVFVRYMTADGRRLETDRAIEVALPGEQQAGWTPGTLPSIQDAPAAEPSTPRTAGRSRWSPDRR